MDPDVFTTAIAAVLSEYPEDVVRQVTDPRRGIPARSKWFPSIAELKAACDDVMRTRRPPTMDRLPPPRANPDRDAVRRGFRKLSELLEQANGS